MRTRLPVLVVLTGSLLVGGCARDGGGGRDDPSASADESPGATATPSTDVLSGTFSGRFRLVDNPPEDSAEVTGTATMEVDQDAGTSVEIAGVSGLDEKAVYVAHIHDDACAAQDPGGARFRFDPDGPARPPNEVHLTIDVEDGEGSGKTTNDEAVTAEARSVVIHLERVPGAKKDETNPPKVACADLVQE